MSGTLTLTLVMFRFGFFYVRFCGGS